MNCNYTKYFKGASIHRLSFFEIWKKEKVNSFYVNTLNKLF